MNHGRPYADDYYEMHVGRMMNLLLDLRIISQGTYIGTLLTRAMIRMGMR